MTLIGSITNAISRFNMPSGMQSTLSAVSKEGAPAILPIEVSVTGGRSIEAAHRSGFLEFQERVFEETTAAIVWLFGVSYLRKVFDKYKDKIAPNLKHLDLDIAYNSKVGKLFKSVETSAQEGYLFNALENNKWLKIKGMQWIFSVGLAVGTCAVVIPWLNKKKTDWYVEHIYKPQHMKKALARARQKEIEQQQQAIQSAMASSGIQNPSPIAPAMQPSGIQPGPQRGFSPSLGYPQQAAFQNQPRFGGWGSLLQAAGNLIEQTPYGSILVVDSGVTGGRVVSYGKRNPFEGLEVLIRDGVSLYFYMAAVPHMLHLASKAIDPAMKTTMLFAPDAAGAVNDALLKGLAGKYPNGKIPVNDVRTLIDGSSHDALGLADGWLKGAMRAAPTANGQGRAGFLNLLQSESANYGVDKHLGSVHTYLKSRLGENYAKRLTVDDVEDLLDAIRAHRGPFASLQPQRNVAQNAKAWFADKAAMEQADLITAIKQSFQHTAGIAIDPNHIEKSLKAAGADSPFAKIFARIPESERTALLARIRNMSAIDAQEAANTMFRRYLTLGRSAMNATDSNALLQHAEGFAQWLEKANAHKVPLATMLDSELAEVKAELVRLSIGGKLGHQVTPAKIESMFIGHQWQDLTQLASSVPEKTVGKLGRKLKGDSTLADRVGALRKFFAPLEETGVRIPASTQEAVEKSLAHWVSLLQAEAAKANANKATTDAMRYYGEELSKLVSGKKGLLRSLYVEDAIGVLDGKIHELMRGGLKYDNALFKATLNATNELVEDGRRFVNLSKLGKARKLMQDYLDRILANVEDAGGTEFVQKALEDVIKAQTKLNQNTHMFVRLGALLTTMLAIGWGVPKLQYAITKKLTGKNEHPTFAALKAEEANEEKAEIAEFDPARHDLYSGPPLNRNNVFQMFEQQTR